MVYSRNKPYRAHPLKKKGQKESSVGVKSVNNNSSNNTCHALAVTPSTPKKHDAPPSRSQCSPPGSSRPSSSSTSPSEERRCLARRSRTTRDRIARTAASSDPGHPPRGPGWTPSRCTSGPSGSASVRTSVRIKRVKCNMGMCIWWSLARKMLELMPQQGKGAKLQLSPLPLLGH